MAVILFFTAFFPFNFSQNNMVYAANTDVKFDDTNVLDDLKSSTVKGKPFNLLNYPFDSTGLVKHPEIINVVEYCYSYKVNMQSNYGLYLYFYNPQGLNIDTASKSNKVQLAVSYTKDSDENDMPNGYEKFDLEFCSRAEESKYKNLFYKFKIKDRIGADGKTILQRVNSNGRRYDISGVELHTYGEPNATDYTVGGTYEFSGYAKGYGADSNSESDLACDVRNLETIFLDLAGKTDGVDKRTYWRSNSSGLGKNHQNQINSVFFAIDKNVLEKYGYILQRIKAEWWEYKTRPAVVVDNLAIYNNLLKYNGVKITNSYDQGRGYTMHDKDFEYISSGVGGMSTYCWSYNAELGSMGGSTYFSEDIETLLPLLFSTGGISVNDYVLSAEVLQKYFKSYNKSYEKGHLLINGGHDYSADLFSDSVDSGRIMGKNERVFDIGKAEDYWDIRSYDSTHNWWNKLWDYGFGGVNTNDDFPSVAPIQMLNSNDLNVSDVATHLKINTSDVERLKTYYNSVKKDSEVFIFRYATTDYFATDLSIFAINEGKYGVHYDTCAEIRQGTQFFDFDILEFTFNNDGVYTVIPVVSSPIDHWSDYTPSIDSSGCADINWKQLLMILLLILLLIVCAPLLPVVLNLILWVIKGVLWLIIAPFRLIGNAVNKKKQGKRG